MSAFLFSVYKGSSLLKDRYDQWPNVKKNIVSLGLSFLISLEFATRLETARLYSISVRYLTCFRKMSPSEKILLQISDRHAEGVAGQ